MGETCDFADGVMIRRLREKKDWKTREQFEAAIKNATGREVSEPSIKRALKGDRMTEDILGKIAKAFEVPPWVVTIPCNQRITSYTWEHMMAGARKVAREVFKRPPADAVLTFPGASSIFAGLVLVTLRDLTRFLRIPVYTAIFKGLNEKGQDKHGEFPGFHVAKTKCFKILVPDVLFKSNHKKVVVIDDTILSGGTMDKLREELLDPHFGKGNVIFACCICHESLTFGNRTAPEIIGLPQLEARKKFPMPWGIDAYRNEEGFATSEQDRDSIMRED